MDQGDGQPALEPHREMWPDLPKAFVRANHRSLCKATQTAMVIHQTCAKASAKKPH
jgi:hypothetical protein